VGVGGLAPTPKAPIPNPQSPIPIAKDKLIIELKKLYKININILCII
jgi:hypothetical protein